MGVRDDVSFGRHPSGTRLSRSAGVHRQGVRPHRQSGRDGRDDRGVRRDVVARLSAVGPCPHSVPPSSGSHRSLPRRCCAHSRAGNRPAVRGGTAAGCDVTIGIAELDETSAGTVYCTLLFISAEGEILGKHRKLKPTDAERTAWGEGDGTGLRPYARPYASISGLNCWEHNMVLPGYALMAQGTQIHIAAFPGHETEPVEMASTRQLLLARAFASQAAAYVVLVGGLIHPDEIADDELREVVSTTQPMNGGSYIIDPMGQLLAGPAQGEEILLAEGSLDVVRAAKAMCDVAGHYSRPDILRLVLNRNPARRLVEEET